MPWNDSSLLFCKTWQGKKESQRLKERKSSNKQVAASVAWNRHKGGEIFSENCFPCKKAPILWIMPIVRKSQSCLMIKYIINDHLTLSTALFVISLMKMCTSLWYVDLMALLVSYIILSGLQLICYCCSLDLVTLFVYMILCSFVVETAADFTFWFSGGEMITGVRLSLLHDFSLSVCLPAPVSVFFQLAIAYFLLCSYFLKSSQVLPDFGGPDHSSCF